MIRVRGKRTALFLCAFILTFTALRIYLFYSPNTDMYIGDYNIHHIYTGIILIAVFGVPLVIMEGKSRLLDISAIGFGAGLAMALDETIFLIVTDGTNSSYLLPVSLFGGIFLISAATLWTMAILIFVKIIYGEGDD